MKIVVLEGSPNRHGSSNMLADCFKQGAEDAGHTVEIIDAAHADIHPCTGCIHCGYEGPCVQKDGMMEVYPAVKEADVVVLATPLYYWNMSGQLRTAIDRLFALEEGGENLLRGHGRCCALLMAAEGSDFADVLTYYEHLAGHLQWKNLGHVLAGGNFAVGDIAGKKELEDAYSLGAGIC